MAILSTAQLHPQLTLNQSSMVFDDFYSYTDAQLWTKVAGSTGTTAADDTSGADQLLLTTAATLNDYEGVRSTKQNFLWTTGIGMYFETYVNYTSQSSNNITIGGGFSSSSAVLASSTADPSVSYSGALIYRLSGDTNWRVQSSNGSAKTTTVASGNSGVNCADGYHLLRIDVVNWDANNAKVIYMVDTVPLKDANGQLITHKVAYTSLAKMYVLAVTVAAGANAQTANVDYIGAGKWRNLLQGE